MVQVSDAVLVVDVGNTETRFGLFEAAASVSFSAELLATWMLTTPTRLTADEAYLQLKQVLSAFAETLGVERVAPEGSILSCVVPTLTDTWKSALKRICGKRALVVGPGLKSGMRLSYDDPSEIGPDRIADAVAARGRYGAPCIVVDLGTTTNIEVVDAQGAFAGGLIAPGLYLGARSLSDAAARLPMVELAAPKHVVGKSTREAMRSGVVLGEVARIDGLLSMVERELGAAAPIVMTGSPAAPISKLLAHEVQVDEALTLRGLAMLYGANARSK